MTGNTEKAIELSKPMVQNKTMPFYLIRELATNLASDDQLYHAEAAILIDEILDTMTPADKQKFLEIL